MILRKVRNQPRTTWEDLHTPSWIKIPYGNKAPLLMPGNVQARLKFTNDHQDDPEEAWEKIMWKDETKIELFVVNSTLRVWRKKKDEYNPKNTVPTSKLFRRVIGGEMN